MSARIKITPLQLLQLLRMGIRNGKVEAMIEILDDAILQLEEEDEKLRMDEYLLKGGTND